MKQYLITRNYTETIQVGGRDAADALSNANDYSNNNKWSTTHETYKLEEL